MGALTNPSFQLFGLTVPYLKSTHPDEIEYNITLTSKFNFGDLGVMEGGVSSVNFTFQDCSDHCRKNFIGIYGSKDVQLKLKHREPDSVAVQVVLNWLPYNVCPDAEWATIHYTDRTRVQGVVTVHLPQNLPSVLIYDVPYRTNFYVRYEVDCVEEGQRKTNIYHGSIFTGKL